MSAPDQSSRAPSMTFASGANNRNFSNLFNNRRTRLIKARATLNANITVAGTAIRNRGSLSGAFTEFGLSEAGTDRAILDPRAAVRLSNALSQKTAPNVRLATAGIQNVNLSEEFFLYLSHPLSANPQESFYVEADIKNTLQAFSTYNGVGANLITAGTIALSLPVVTVRQDYDALVSDRPAVDIFVRQITQTVSAANPALVIDLRGSRYLAGILVTQESNVGEEINIINQLVFRGDGYDIVGPQLVPFTELVQEQASWSPGADVDGVSWYYNFIKSGRMSTMLHPSMIPNLRLEVDCQPSVTAGAVSSTIRVVMVEYERRPGVTSADMPFTV